VLFQEEPYLWSLLFYYRLPVFFLRRRKGRGKLVESGAVSGLVVYFVIWIGETV
jgi:hypothetical protein